MLTRTEKSYLFSQSIQTSKAVISAQDYIECLGDLFKMISDQLMIFERSHGQPLASEWVQTKVLQIIVIMVIVPGLITHDWGR